MKKPYQVSREEYEKFLHDNVLGPNKPLGFYIYLLFAAGALVSIAMHGAWSVLWSVLIIIPMTFFAISKASFWNWTEKKLKSDAEAGRISKAVYWDYLCATVDWAVEFAVFAMAAFAVFTLADGKMPIASAWLCVGALCPVIGNTPYNWGNYCFWGQLATIAITISSVFIPVTPVWGVALRAATALVSVPMICLYKRDEIWGKASTYFQNAKAARVMYVEPPPVQSQSPQADMLKAIWAGSEIRRNALAASGAMIAAGLVWLLCLHKPLAPLATLPVALLGAFVNFTLANPTNMPDDVLVKRNLDLDLVRHFIHIRALTTMVALAVASAVVLWLGDRDIRALAALSLLTVGMCSVTSTMDAKDSVARKDAFILIVYSVALTLVVTLRLCGMTLLECLAPLPLVAYLMPAFRWFFPRSGLRGEARRAAIEDMPRRLAADIRTAAEKDRDAKMEKRRLRDAKRVARIKKA